MSLSRILLFPIATARSVLSGFFLLSEAGDTLAQENGDRILL